MNAPAQSAHAARLAGMTQTKAASLPTTSIPRTFPASV